VDVNANATRNELAASSIGALKPVGWWIERASALVLALLLLRSSFAHLGNPYYFLSTVYSYQLVGIRVGQWVSLVLPFLQLTTAIALLLRWWITEAFVLAAIQFLTFSIIQAVTIYRGLDISCGCFGASNSLKVGWSTFAISTTALGVAMLGWWGTRSNRRRGGGP